MKKYLVSIVLAAGVGAIGLPTMLDAAVVGIQTAVDLSAGVYTIKLGSGATSYTFGKSTSTGPFGNILPSVTTGGSATVASNGAPFYDPPRPATYFTDDGRTPVFDNNTLVFPT